MKARTLLAWLSVLQLAAICLNFTASSIILFMTLPFSIAGLAALWIAIYYKWRTGIIIFICLCLYLLIYALVRLGMLVYGIGGDTWDKKPFDTAGYCIQIILECFCIFVALWVMFVADSFTSGESEKEKEPLLGSKKGKV